MQKLFSFVGMACDYYRMSTDAPLAYCEATALSILGHSLGREVVHLIQPKAVYHNSYVCLVGKSTKSRKTTVQELGQDLYNEEMWLPNESSPEKLLENLSGKPQGFCWLGEFSKILKGIKSGGYMATIAETYNDLFNCPRRYVRDLVKGTFTIENAYLSLHSTITPEVLKENITTEMFHGGLLPRWLILHAQPRPKPRGKLSKRVFKLNEIIRSTTNALLKMDKSNTYFEMTDEALKYFNTEIEEKVIYSEDYECVGAFAGRYENYIISFADLYLISDAIGVALDQGLQLSKIANLVDLVNLVCLPCIDTVSNTKNNNTITNSTNCSNSSKHTNCAKTIPVSKEYVERAWNFVKPSLDYVRELSTFIDMEKPLAKVREKIMTHKTISRVRLLQNTNLSSIELNNAINTLVGRDEIELVVDSHSTGVREYKKQSYRWIGKTNGLVRENE